MNLSLPDHEPRCKGRDFLTKQVCAEKFICRRYAAQQAETTNPDGCTRLVWAAVSPSPKTGLCDARIALQPAMPIVVRREVAEAELID